MFKDVYGSTIYICSSTRIVQHIHFFKYMYLTEHGGDAHYRRIIHGYVYIYVYIHTYTYVYIYIYIYIYVERERL